MISTTSFPPAALSVKSARKRSCSGVEPDVLSKVARSEDSWVGVNVTDIAAAVPSFLLSIQRYRQQVEGIEDRSRDFYY
jgi:hypothetical protein